MTIIPFPGGGTRESRSGTVAAGAASDERPRKNGCVRDELLADGSMVLYHTCRQELMTLNPTAALVWECCDGAHSIAMIGEELREVFPDAADITTDVLPLLQELIAHAMIADDNL